MHFGKLPQYCNFKMSGLNSGTTKPASLPPAVDAQESVTEYPWDEDDSFYESDDAFSIEANISTAAPNNEAGVYTESPNDAALVSVLLLPSFTKLIY